MIIFMNFKEWRYHYNGFNQMKILIHAAEIEKMLRGEVPSPIDIDLDLSNYCNQSCVWCEPGLWRRKNLASLSEEVVKAAIKDAAEMRVKLIKFSGGGEPMMNPVFPKAIRWAKLYGMEVAVNSNGVLTKKYADALLKYCDFYRASVDAATKKTYNKLHKPNNKGDFDRVIEGLKILARGRKRMKHKTGIGVGFLIHFDNWEEIYPFAKMMKNIGVDFIHYRPTFLSDREESERLRKLVNSKALKEIERARKDFEDEDFGIYGIMQKMDGVWTPRYYSKCYAPLLFPVLGADGKMHTCCERRELVYGDFAKEGFKNSWHTKRHRNLVAGIDINTCPRCTHNKTNEIIENCFVKDSLKRNLI